MIRTPLGTVPPVLLATLLTGFAPEVLVVTWAVTAPVRVAAATACCGFTAAATASVSRSTIDDPVSSAPAIAGLGATVKRSAARAPTTGTIDGNRR